MSGSDRTSECTNVLAFALAPGTKRTVQTHFVTLIIVSQYSVPRQLLELQNPDPSCQTHEAVTGTGETGRLREGACALGFQWTSLALVTEAQRSLAMSGHPPDRPGGSHTRGCLCPRPGELAGEAAGAELSLPPSGGGGAGSSLLAGRGLSPNANRRPHSRRLWAGLSEMLRSQCLTVEDWACDTQSLRPYPPTSVIPHTHSPQQMILACQGKVYFPCQVLGEMRREKGTVSFSFFLEKRLNFKPKTHDVYVMKTAVLRT